MRWTKYQRYSGGNWTYLWLVLTVIAAVIIGRYLYEVG